MNIEPGVKMRTVVVAGVVNHLTIRRGTYVLPFPWARHCLRVEKCATVHYLNIEQPITVWSWHGWFRFGKTTSNMPSGNYGAVRA